MTEKKRIEKCYIREFSLDRMDITDIEVILVSDIKDRLEYFEQNYPPDFFFRIKRLLHEFRVNNITEQP